MLAELWKNKNTYAVDHNTPLAKRPTRPDPRFGSGANAPGWAAQGPHCCQGCVRADLYTTTRKCRTRHDLCLQTACFRSCRLRRPPLCGCESVRWIECQKPWGQAFRCDGALGGRITGCRGMRRPRTEASPLRCDPRIRLVRLDLAAGLLLDWRRVRAAGDDAHPTADAVDLAKGPWRSGRIRSIN